MASRRLLVCAPLALLLLLAVGLPIAPVSAQRTMRRPTLIVLGDSFSDIGDGSPVTNNTIPSPAQGYYNGRMSNGPVWSDYIANATGVALASYAKKGATACRPPIPNAGLPFTVPFLAEQALHAAADKRNFSSNSAVVVFIGTNDISILAQGLLMGQLNFSDALAAIPTINACIKEAVEGVVKYGLTQSVTVLTTPNLPLSPLWDTIFSANGVPPAIGQQFLGGLGVLLRALNEGIKNDLDDLADAYRRASFQVYDFYNMVTTVYYEPHAYGFTNVTAACQPYSPLSAVPGTPGNTIISTCPNPNEHLFWDVQHVSTAFHALLARDLQHKLATGSDLFM